MKCDFICLKHKNETATLEDAKTKKNNKRERVQNPLVSIIIPLYNYEKYVVEAINSVLEQTYKNWELIIVDDCSTDNSYNVVEIFLNTLTIELKNKIHLYQNNKNLNKSKSVNFAATKATGDYVFIFDADDILVNTFLEEFIHTFQNNDVDIVTCYEQQFGNENKILKPADGKMFKYSSFRSVIWRIMCSLSAFRKVNGYLETINSMVDYEFSVRLSIAGFNRAIRINKVLYLYRKHGNSLFNHQLENRTELKAIMILNSKEYYNKYYVYWAEGILCGNEQCKKLDNDLPVTPDFINLLAYFEKDNWEFIKKELENKFIPFVIHKKKFYTNMLIKIKFKNKFYTKIPINMPDNSVIYIEYLPDVKTTIGYKN